MLGGTARASKDRYMSFRILKGLSFALCMVTLLPHCAVQRDGINRVQPNALQKSFFVGDLSDESDDPMFVTRNFVVDASEAQELVGISTASGVERIRWQITEDTLFARRAYSITNGDNKGTSIEPNGDIIAAYKIDSHFDVRNAYNPATGEELAVQEENTSDRPWYERDHFRVDWSKNLVDSPVWTTMFYGKVFGDIKVTPISYYESDETSDDAPHFDAETGYLDVTSHFLVEPEMTQWGAFEIPMCFIMGMFTGSAIYSCEAQEAVLRTSFWKLQNADPDEDFEPFENTEAPREIFGNPGGIGDSTAHGIVPAPLEEYDPQYGYTDEGLTRLMLTHNIWQQSHQTVGECSTSAECEDVTGRKGSTCLSSGRCSVPCSYKKRLDVDANGTDDQCENDDTGYEGSSGSQCSLRDRCTIPYRDREVRPVTYYVDPEMPEELQDRLDKKGKVKQQGANEDLIATWNQALQLAVATAREVECRRTSSDGNSEQRRSECHQKYFEVQDGKDVVQMVSYGGWGVPTPRKAADVLVLCHNPVREYDHPACGEVGERSRPGDIRKNMLIYWNYSTQAPYGGIGGWRADPSTGQIFGASATTIGRSVTSSAARVRDLILVSLGELDFEDITSGVSATRFQKTLENGRSPETFTADQLAERLTAIDHRHLGQQVDFDLSAVDLSSPAAAVAGFKSNLVIDPAQRSRELLRYKAAVAPLLGTQLEAQMVSGNWILDAVGANPASPLTDQLLDVASPLRSYDLGQMASTDQRVLQALGQRGVCHLDALVSIGTPEITGLGRYYREKYPELTGRDFADAVYEDLWVEVYKGIQLHEIGHSLGLLHNFASSWDAANFNPQYWQLRTHEGTRADSCNSMPRDASSTAAEADTCMGPRYLDPETDDEMGLGAEPRPGLNYYGHTSTMEYQNARFFETVGLGQYDVMAMKALYGRTLETLDTRELPAAEQANFLALNETQLSDESRVHNVEYGFPLGVHYTELARQLRIFDPARCREATEQEKAKAEWRIVHGKVCAPPSKDHGHWDDFVDTASSPSAVEGRKIRVPSELDAPAAGNTRWPYRFGGDQSNGYMHINPFDSGADAYEVTMETIRKNDYNYPLTYFRAQRRGWTTLQLPSYTARNFYERLRSYHWSVSFQNAFYTNLQEEVPNWEPIFEEWRQSDDQMRPGLIAQTEMFKGIAAVLLAPEPGAYQALEPQGTFYDTGRVVNTREEFVLDAASARFLAPSYDSGPEAGGSWDYHTYAQRGGYEVEKALAARALTDGRAVFSSFSRDIYLDDRIININFRSDMPQAVDRLLGGALAEQWETVSQYVNQTEASAGDPVVRMADLLSDAPALPAEARQVFPNFGYNQAVPTLVYSHLYGRLNSDLELSNKMRMWVDGSISGELDLPESEQARFTYPESGITYIARRFGPDVLFGREVDKGISSRMIDNANRLLGEVYELDVDEDGNVVRDEFNRPLLQRDDAGSPLRKQGSVAERARTQLRRYVGQLDATVQISDYIGYGPFNFR